MKTIFALFEDYASAQTAVKALLREEFDAAEMNVIVQEEIAKDAMEIDLERANVAVTDEVGEQRAQGLDRLLGGQQAVTLPDVEAVLAAGEMATILAKTGAAGQGLKPMLREFDLSEEVAEAYRTGVVQGGVLFWIRTADERASQAANLLREHHATRVIG